MSDMPKEIYVGVCDFDGYVFYENPEGMPATKYIRADLASPATDALVSAALVKIIDVAVWMKTLADSNARNAQDTRFQSLADACKKDAKQYAKAHKMLSEAVDALKGG
jgi:hypothetical protein